MKNFLDKFQQIDNSKTHSMSIFLDKFQKHINYRLDTSKIKITDLVLEELISNALEDANLNCVYESGSHKKGSDMETEFGKVSVKSSGTKSKLSASISSFRMTRFKDDIQNMLNFIDGEGKNFDLYFVLFREETKSKTKYIFYILPSDIFSATSMKWVESFNKKGTLSGWKTVDNDNITLKIQKNMSNQLWIELKRDFIKDFVAFEVTRNKSDLGKKRFVA
jgi:hypothetical protein